MSIKALVSGYLDRSEAGRIFKARVGAAMRAHSSPASRRHPGLGPLCHMLIEASFLCNLECRMCPRLFEGHTEGLMPMDRFQRLLPLLRHMDAVSLTGYGEPMVHPRLHEFAALIRGTGCMPRLSTNGTLLSEEKSGQLLDAGIENLQISIDAGTAATYEYIRVGAKWERVLRNAERFNNMRRTRGEGATSGWVFVMLRENFRELPLAAEWAAKTGFDVFTAKLIERNALDYEQANNLYADDGTLLADAGEYEDAIAGARAVCEREGVEFHANPFHMGFNNTCLADPLQMIFVDWMGNVSPCCHLPVRNEMGHFPAHSFGNIDEEEPVEILLGERAQQFWRLWRNRTVPNICRNCYQVSRMPDRENLKYEPVPDGHGASSREHAHVA